MTQTVRLTYREPDGTKIPRGKPKGTLESEIRIAISLSGPRPPRYTGAGSSCSSCVLWSKAHLLADKKTVRFFQALGEEVDVDSEVYC